MARVVIPVYDRFDLLDVCGPAEMFSWAQDSSWTVDLLAEVPPKVSSISGIVLEVPNGIPAKVEHCDAMWIPGGDPVALDRIIHDPQRVYLNFIAEQARSATWVCSVCEGALLAAAAGLLDGHRATTHWAFEPWLREYFPRVSVVPGHPRFVLDGNRLTGGGISAGLDESLRLIELISGTEAAQDVQRTAQYYPDPPVSSRIPHHVPMPLMPTPP